MYNKESGQDYTQFIEAPPSPPPPQQQNVINSSPPCDWLSLIIGIILMIIGVMMVINYASKKRNTKFGFAL